MGYDVHITRRESWSDDIGLAISETEWREVIESDPELLLDTTTVVESDDGPVVFAIWNGCEAAFGLSNGSITAKNPDRATIEKMILIAASLDAQVQGDDGERYPESFASGSPPVDSVAAKRSFWARLFGR